MQNDYLISIKKLFLYYKKLGENAFNQISDEMLFYADNENSNSIAVIVQHLSGNMLSRWTDFLISDGEKTWRNRDTEFEIQINDRTQLKKTWENGWQCLFNTIDPLTARDLNKIIYIRNEGHSVLEAINRQLAHYSYHIGQIVYVSKKLQTTIGKVYLYQKINQKIIIKINFQKVKKIPFLQINYN